jgi:hypothetical protein
MRSLSDIFDDHKKKRRLSFMRLLVQILVLSTMFAISACGIHNPQNTSAARAAYGDTTPDFKANRKMNQKKKKSAQKEAKRKKTRGNRSYFEGRPY